MSSATTELTSEYGVELAVEDRRDSPHVFVGSLDHLVEKFRNLRRTLGISSIMVGPIDGLAPVVERLAGT